MELLLLQIVLLEVVIMITNAILSFFSSIAGFILSPLTVLDVVVDLVTSIPIVTKFIMFVSYIIPWNNLVPLILIVFALLGFRIIIALIKFVITFIPFF